jgi:hypothetical protein
MALKHFKLSVQDLCFEQPWGAVGVGGTEKSGMCLSKRHAISLLVRLRRVHWRLFYLIRDRRSRAVENRRICGSYTRCFVLGLKKPRSSSAY